MPFVILIDVDSVKRAVRHLLMFFVEKAPWTMINKRWLMTGSGMFSTCLLDIKTCKSRSMLLRWSPGGCRRSWISLLGVQKADWR